MREEQVVDEEAPVGEVVDQEPAANDEAPRGSEVTLFVSKGPADRPVPDVVGKTVAEASNLLGQAGFTVNQTAEASNTVEEGRVIRTDPPAGRRAAQGLHGDGRRVDRSGRGPPCPSVEGLTEANAINVLERPASRSPRSGTPPTTAPKTARVDSQNPAGNTTAADGSTVTIVVGCDVADGRRRGADGG